MVDVIADVESDAAFELRTDNLPVGDWQAYSNECRKREEIFSRLRGAVEATIPMRRKAASGWMARWMREKGTGDVSDLVAHLQEVVSGSSRGLDLVSPGELQDALFALCMDANTVRIAKLRKYAAHLESELSRVKAELAGLGA